MEAMTVELIIDAYWKMQNYFTIPRYFIQTPLGGNSDIDILAYNVRKKSIVFGESKAHGGKNMIKQGILDKSTLNQIISNQTSLPSEGEDDQQLKGKDDFLKFCSDVHVYISAISETANSKFPVDLSDLKSIKLHFVSTRLYTKEEGIIDQIESYFRDFILKKWGIKIDVEVKIETHFDVLVELIKAVGQHEQGKRYGNPVLDIIRELNRYLYYPDQESSKKKSKEKFHKAFLEAMGV